MTERLSCEVVARAALGEPLKREHTELLYIVQTGKPWPEPEKPAADLPLFAGAE